MAGFFSPFFVSLRVGPDPGPLARWLSDPAGFERELWLRCRAAFPLLLMAVVPVVVVLIGCWLVVRLHRIRAWRRAADAACWVAVEPPERSETANGQEMWRQLLGLLRPRAGASMRVLGWEVHAAGERVVGGLWVPETVGPRQAAQCVSAAYRRCRTRVQEPPGAGNGGRAVAGFVVVPRTSMWQPLLADTAPGSGRFTSHRAGGSGTGWVPDPLDGLWQVLSALPEGYTATVQVLVRPLPRGIRAAARAVRVADGDRPAGGLGVTVAGGLATVVADALVGVPAAVVDVVTPRPSVRGTSARGSVRAPRQPVNPVTAQERRAAAVKARAELVEACIRVVVSGPDPRECRERAWLAANSLRAVVTGQPLDVVRLGSPQKRVTARSLRHGFRVRARRAGHRRGWFVVTDTELGALARLPHRPALYRFETAGAPQLPVPAGVTRLGRPEVGR
jgi:hypothetical protein